MRSIGTAAVAVWLFAPMLPACSDDLWLVPGASSAQDGASVPPQGDDGGATQGSDAVAPNEASVLDAATVDDTSVPPIDSGDADAEAGGANASLCAGSAFALCDGFESGGIDSKTWTMASDNGGGATIVVDTVRAKRGTHSLHVHLPQGTSGQSAGARMFETQTFPALQKALYGRVFVYLLGAPPGKHTPFVAVEETSPDYHYYGTEEKNGGQLYATQGGGGIDEGFGSATVIAHDKWVCLEWYYSGAGEVRTWLDGSEITDIHETGFLAASFTDVLLGLSDEDLSTVALAAGFDAWFDEVAIGQSPIGCAN
jgi:hypothetical protein